MTQGATDILLRTRTTSGRIAVRWPPFEAHSAWVIIVLRDPRGVTLQALHAHDFDNDLIRVPVDAGRGEAEVFVPADRWVGLFLAARDQGGQRMNTPGLSLEDAEDAAAEPARQLVEPVRHSHAPAADTPFVFVESDQAPPSLQALARRVADSVAGGGAAGIGDAAPKVGAFGTRQKWYLTRLGFASGSGGPRVLVARRAFISDADLADWRDTPPADAIVVEPGADGVIDGQSPDGTTTFYALLEGPAPWRPLAVTPVPPLFESVRRPQVIGSRAAERLAASIQGQLRQLVQQPLALSDLELRLSLLRAAVAWLAEGAPLRHQVESAAARIHAEERF